MQKLHFLIIAVIVVILFLVTPKQLLFYDAPEYIKIVAEQPFSKAIITGHPPLRPLFMSILWVSSHLITTLGRVDFQYAGNLTAFIFGVISIALFYRLANLLFKDRFKMLLSTLLFSIFPLVWILNSNLLVESILLPSFIFAMTVAFSYLKYNNKISAVLLAISVWAMLVTHIESGLWLPSLIALPLLFGGEGKRIFKLFPPILLGVALFFSQYVVFFLLQQKPVIQSIGQELFGRVNDVYVYDGILNSSLRIFRNISLQMLRGYGILTVIIAALLILKSKFQRYQLLGLGILAASTLIIAGMWTGDFMLRRIAFLSLFFSLYLTQQLKNKVLFVIVFLFPILIFNSLLYFSNNMPLVLMKEMEKNLPNDVLLLQTHYVAPFTADKRILYLDLGYQTAINAELKKGNEVLLDSQAVYAPYLLYVGNNIHITSLSRFGQSDYVDLFKQYTFDLEKIGSSSMRIFTYRINSGHQDIEKRIADNKKLANDTTEIIIGKTLPGSPVFVYSKDFSQRIHRERIDYGDPLLWLWVIVTDRKEPLYWTYGDKEGIFVLPVVKSNNLYLEGKNLELL